MWKLLKVKTKSLKSLITFRKIRVMVVKSARISFLFYLSIGTLIYFSVFSWIHNQMEKVEETLGLNLSFKPGVFSTFLSRSVLWPEYHGYM